MLSDIEQVNLPQYWLVNGKVENITIRQTILMHSSLVEVTSKLTLGNV